MRAPIPQELGLNFGTMQVWEQKVELQTWFREIVSVMRRMDLRREGLGAGSLP